MPELLSPYVTLVQASAVIAALVLVQLLVADLTGIRAGHVPGSPVPSEHRLFLFRAVRAHANTVENLAVYVLLAGLALVSAASPKWTGVAAWMFAGARTAHMLCYYADWRLARSVAFGIGLLAQFVMLGLVSIAILRLI